MSGYCVQLGAGAAGCEARSCSMGVLSGCGVGLFCLAVERSPACSAGSTTGTGAGSNPIAAPTVFVPIRFENPQRTDPMPVSSVAFTSTANTIPPLATNMSPPNRGIGTPSSNSNANTSTSNPLSPLLVALSSVAVMALFALVALLALIRHRRRTSNKTQLDGDCYTNLKSATAKPASAHHSLPPPLRDSYKPAFYYRDDFFDSDEDKDSDLSTAFGTDIAGYQSYLDMHRQPASRQRNADIQRHARTDAGIPTVIDVPARGDQEGEARREFNLKFRQDQERAYLMALMQQQVETENPVIYAKRKSKLLEFQANLGTHSGDLYCKPPTPPNSLNLIDIEERNRREIEELHRVIVGHLSTLNRSNPRTVTPALTPTPIERIVTDDYASTIQDGPDDPVSPTDVQKRLFEEYQREWEEYQKTQAMTSFRAQS
ncbi:hypothetical protein HDU78_009396 [Chytriomyces hyalinus]|nr:hypothetical protein HDU78_009396 [Chytriomyces hyalinus]